MKSSTIKRVFRFLKIKPAVELPHVLAVACENSQLENLAFAAVTTSAYQECAVTSLRREGRF